MAKNLLKEASIRNAKPAAQFQRLSDGEGLYLQVNPNGSKWWRFAYTFEFNRKTISLGVYPDVSLSLARVEADKARASVAAGIDPSATRKEGRQAKKQAIENAKRSKAGLPVVGSFEDIARQWMESIKHQLADSTYKIKLSRFAQYTFPAIGHKPIGSVTSKDILSIVKPVEQTGKRATAKAINMEIGAVFSYAIVHDLASYDPSQPVTKQLSGSVTSHRAALTKKPDIAKLLRDIDAYNGSFVVKSALKLMPMLFQRPSEICQMEWKDIDFEAKEWRYIVKKIKSRYEHIVPLSDQAITILAALHERTGVGRYVFPNAHNANKPMTTTALLTALYRLGYHGVMTTHGFRTIASTKLNELRFTPDAIERQLSHMPKDEIRAAYNRAEYLKERRSMMQDWSDYLDGIKGGADVIAIGSRRA
jgi:integrase